MTVADYYNVLGLTSPSTIDEIKRAYRIKARAYHPDINHDADAKDMFIAVTEAYEFLVTYSKKMTDDQEAFNRAMEDWRKYRQDRSRQRARAYSNASYIRFKKTKFYRTTRILDGTTIIFSLLISTAMLLYTVIGYYYRLRHPLPDIENPSVFTFLMLLTLSLIFFVLSTVYLKVYIESSRKRKSKKSSVA